jgi:hypothetical protein
MFNFAKSKKSKTTIEKRTGADILGPKADDKQNITERELPHRSNKTEFDVTEANLEKSRSGSDDLIIEKALNDASKYVSRRSDAAQISVPPMSILVEKLRQKRLDDDWKESKKSSHWTVTMSGKDQNKGLPDWPRSPSQHDKIVLNNDPRRFEPVKNMPVNPEQSKNDSARGKANEPKSLLGGITTATADSMARAIKTGQTIDFDTAMVAILREAEQEKRELTSVEQKAIADLKLARTQALLKCFKS